MSPEGPNSKRDLIHIGGGLLPLVILLPPLWWLVVLLATTLLLPTTLLGVIWHLALLWLALLWLALLLIKWILEAKWAKLQIQCRYRGAIFFGVQIGSDFPRGGYGHTLGEPPLIYLGLFPKCLALHPYGILVFIFEGNRKGDNFHSGLGGVDSWITGYVAGNGCDCIHI